MRAIAITIVLLLAASAACAFVGCGLRTATVIMFQPSSFETGLDGWTTTGEGTGSGSSWASGGLGYGGTGHAAEVLNLCDPDLSILSKNIYFPSTGTVTYYQTTDGVTTLVVKLDGVEWGSYLVDGWTQRTITISSAGYHTISFEAQGHNYDCDGYAMVDEITFAP